MPIEQITASYYRLPIEPSGEAGHGLRFDRQALARFAG